MATTNKYDRQLRLWGAHGQKALMESHLLLLGAGATGTETLKNLVLPGVGHITVVDDRKVSEDDCADNFFVERKDLGQPLAKVTSELLVEMNPDVTGAHEVAAPASKVEDAAYIKRFTLVVATQMPEATAKALAATCAAAGVPLVLARTYGLIGLVRLCAKEHLVLESKPDNVRPDWRVYDCFKEFQAFVDSFDLEPMDVHEHGHVPFPVLLVKFMREWVDTKGSRPKSFAEKKEFKKFVMNKSRSPGQELNFIEAEEFAHFAYNKPEIPYDVQRVLAEARTRTLDADTEHFWIVAKAVAEFVDNEGAACLPVCSVLSDITSTTDWYIELQRIYNEKAAADCDLVKGRVTALVAAAGLPEATVPDAYVEKVCKHARFMRSFSYRSLEEETKVESTNKDEFLEALVYCSEGPQTPLAWYLLVRAADRFHVEHGRFPGHTDETLETDAVEVAGTATALCKELGLDPAVLTADHAAEITRYGACEPHTIAAVVGGIAAQEAVKLITHQYEPLNNTYVFNGIAGRGAQYQL